MGVIVAGFYAIQQQSSAIYAFPPAALNPSFGCLMHTCRVPPSHHLYGMQLLAGCGAEEGLHGRGIKWER